jgi:gamma-glutamyltranspeptidase / glutathione hydrolase
MKKTTGIENFSTSKIYFWILIYLLILSNLSVSSFGQQPSDVPIDGIAATAHPLASQAALEIFKKGGNAVDAAVAAAFAIGVVEPDGSGIGGGGGMLIYLNKQKKAFYINYYQRASSKILDVNFNSKIDSKSAKAVLVPGTVAGLTLALEKYGSLPLAAVMAPAIRYAQDGFPIDETLSKIILDNVELLQKYPSTEKLYLREGFPLGLGDTLKNPELAQTLTLIAEKGMAGFYDGEVAKKMSDDVTKEGGALTLNDLRNYKAEVVEPVEGSYRGYKIYSAAAPQSGSTVIETLNMLENENLLKLGHFSHSVECLHLMAEAMRRAYADRGSYLDDPKFEHIPTIGLTSKAYAKTRYEDIDRSVAEPKEYRKTKEGNPAGFDYVGTKSNQEEVKTKSDKQTIIDDKDDEGASSYDRWGDDIFDKFGGRKKKVQQKVETEDTTDVEHDAIEQEASVPGEGGHTTHLSIMDKDGNMVTLTQTLGTFFGSGLTTSGVLMNCGMSNFSVATAINSIKPNKQPRSSIAPTILVKDGKPFMAVGSPGAARIVATVVQLIVNVVDFSMDAESANNAPRFFCQRNDDYLSLESRISPDVQEGLKQKGHRLKVYGDFDLFFGGVQLIVFDKLKNKYVGSADPRRGGVAMGD